MPQLNSDLLTFSVLFEIGTSRIQILCLPNIAVLIWETVRWYQFPSLREDSAFNKTYVDLHRICNGLTNLWNYAPVYICKEKLHQESLGIFINSL